MSENRNRRPHQARNKPFPKAGDLSSGDPKVVSDPIMGESISVSDERKTVILDEDLEGLEFEDKAWLYWKRNKTFIITMIVLVFAIIVGVKGWKIYKSDSFNSLASAYEKASTSEQLEAFAKANSGTALAGVALLQNADALYEAKDYAKAAETYKAACADLDGQVLLGRALLGQAMSVAQSGKSADGKKLLDDIAANKDLSGAYRAEAAFNSAMISLSGGDAKTAKEMLEKIIANPQSAYWAQAAQNALDTID